VCLCVMIETEGKQRQVIGQQGGTVVSRVRLGRAGAASGCVVIAGPQLGQLVAFEMEGR